MRTVYLDTAGLIANWDTTAQWHSEAEAVEIFYNNPCRFFGQSPKWKLKPVE